MKVVKYFILLLSSLCLNLFSAPVQAKDLKNLGQAPLFSGIDQDGNQVTSASSLGKITLVNFFFTSCEGPCPILMEKVKLILDKSKSCRTLNTVSISVDPETDTPEKLKAYAEKRAFNSDNWKLLHIEKDKVIDLINNGFHLGQGDSIATHTTRLVVIDKYSSIRAMVGGTDEDAVDRISSVILELCK
jgi:protein SCO1/2